MNLRNLLSKKSLLLIILIFGFALRINRLDYGFPALFVSNDEAILHQSALNMLANKTPFTLGNYGPLGSYIQVPFLVLSYFFMLLSGVVANQIGFEKLLLTQEGYLLFVPRSISVMFGVLTILMMYKVSMLLFKDKRVALWSSFFAAVSFNLVHISHQARAWSAAIFFALTAVYFAIYAIKSQRAKFVYFSLISAAVAFGFHQLSGIIIILIFSLFFLYKKIFWFRDLVYGMSFWLLLILTFNYFSTGGNFWSLLSSGGSSSVGLTFIPQNLLSLNGWVEAIGRRVNFWKIFTDLILTDGIIVFLALVSLRSSKTRGKILLMIWLFILLSYILVSFVFPPFIRYFFLGFMFLPMFAGFAFNRFLQYRSNVILVILIMLLASFNSIYWNYIMSKTATFEMLQKWVDKNVAVHQLILISHRRNFSYVPSGVTADIIRDKIPGYYRRSSDVIRDTYPANVRDVIYLEVLKISSPEDVAEVAKMLNARYVITSYYFYDGRIPLEKEGYEKVAHFSPTGNKLYGKKIPEAFFDASYFIPIFQLERAGPYIDIFKVS